ncbi:MAG: hypothetical protein U0174_07355 [Polyangiaceae bacterium]
MLHLARALRAQGREVVLATHGGPYARVLEEANEPYERLTPQMDDARCARFIDDLVQIGKPGVRLLSREEVRASVDAEARFLRERRAEAVVIGFTLTAYLSARVAGIPLVASHGGSFVPPVFERGLLPVPMTMPIPGTSWLPSFIKRAIANAGPERLTGPVAFLNELADELGVERVPSLAALMLGDLTLVTDVPEVLGVPRDELAAWRPRRPNAYRRSTKLVYTGPLFARLDRPIPPAVTSFLDGAKPTAYVVLSSVKADFLHAVVARVRAAGLRVIVGATIHDLGESGDPEIITAGVLPSHLIMPKVDVAVIMGGQGTVQTAMASGTPFVGIPLQPEQELNVSLAHRHGLAIPIAPRHAVGPRLTKAVARLVNEPHHREAARRVRGFYEGVDGAKLGATEIVAYLQRAPGSVEASGAVPS